MSESESVFDDRIRRLTQKHRRMARRGVVHRVGSDGLIVTRARRPIPRFPLRGLVMLLGAAFLFKAYLYASLGETVYADRVEILQSGSIVERGGAWIMQADPVTIWLSEQIARYVI